MNLDVSTILTTDAYCAAFPDAYCKMDVLQYNAPMLWRGRRHTPPPVTATRIVSGHSDFPVTDELTRRYPHATWFGVNNQSQRAIGLPLGITNNTDESAVHRIYGNVDMMVDVASRPREIQNLVYMNFVTETYPQERERVAQMFRDAPWVTVGTPVATAEGRRAFLTEMRNHSYVLCPRGNGVDTHRLWEALYMGSIPIVRRDRAHDGWTDLPILFIDTWEDVTEERLRAALPRFQSTPWNLQKLDVRYWIERIRNESRDNSRRDGYKSPLL